MEESRAHTAGAAGPDAATPTEARPCFCAHCGAPLAPGRRRPDRHAIVEIGLGLAVVAALMLAQARGRTDPPGAGEAVASLSVPADRWLDTGIRVQSGTELKLTASGSWTPEHDNTPQVGPEGVAGSQSGDIMCREAEWGALVARIGDGPYFKIGDGTIIHADRSGELSVGMNDDYYSHNTGDNTGEMTVQVVSRGPVEVRSPSEIGWPVAGR